MSSLAEAERVGAEYGTSTARLGLPLTEAVAAFLASRGPLLAELGGAAGRRRLTASRTAQLLRAAGDALDRVLLGLVAAHVSELTAATAGTQTSNRLTATGDAPVTTAPSSHSRGRP